MLNPKNVIAGVASLLLLAGLAMGQGKTAVSAGQSSANASNGSGGASGASSSNRSAKSSVVPPPVVQPGEMTAASAYCSQSGGLSQVRVRPDNSQYRVCVLPTGRVCEENAFAQGRCGSGSYNNSAASQAAAACTSQGGHHQMGMNGSSATGMCTFPSGRQCDDQALANRTCLPDNAIGQKNR